jgi:hypothetical protein
VKSSRLDAIGERRIMNFDEIGLERGLWLGLKVNAHLNQILTRRYDGGLLL